MEVNYFVILEINLINMSTFRKLLRPLKSISNYITNGLLGWWKFDEGSGAIATDSSGNGNTGVEVGTPSYITGKVGPYALQLNGSTQYVTTANAANFNFSSGSFSISCWIQTTSGACAIFSTIIPPLYSGWELCISEGIGEGMSSPSLGTICFYNGSLWVAFNTVLINDGLWHNVVIVYDGTNLNYYLDGNYIQGMACAQPSYAANPLWIGSRNDTVYPLYFTGDLDDMRIYNRTLSQDEITKIYNLQG